MNSPSATQLALGTRAWNTIQGRSYMPAKLIIIIGFSYLYGFFEVFMNVRSKRKGTVAASGDKGSLWLLY